MSDRGGGPSTAALAIGITLAGLLVLLAVLGVMTLLTG